MEFKNEFLLTGTPDEVIIKFADVPLMASFLPGASVGLVQPDGTYPATLTVAFGPKRLNFKGSLTQSVSLAEHVGELSGTATGDVRGARMAVKLRYNLREGGLLNNRLVTRVEMVSEAQLTGVLAEFARTGGAVVTQALLTEFSRRFGDHMALGFAAVAPASGDNALSATALAGALGRDFWQRTVLAFRKLLRRGKESG
jgi:carbon monoxide dehydrogenase subunit G